LRSHFANFNQEAGKAGDRGEFNVPNEPGETGSTEPDMVRHLYVANTSPETFERVWDAILDVVLPRALIAELDAYPNPTWELYPSLPQPVRDSYEQLMAIAATRPADSYRKDIGMNVHLNLKNEAHVEIARVYGPHSITIEVFDEWGNEVAEMQDCGSGCSASLSLLEVEPA
jgi:hypothetical protein